MTNVMVTVLTQLKVPAPLSSALAHLPHPHLPWSHPLLGLHPLSSQHRGVGGRGGDREETALCTRAEKSLGMWVSNLPSFFFFQEYL